MKTAVVQPSRSVVGFACFALVPALVFQATPLLADLNLIAYSRLNESSYFSATFTNSGALVQTNYRSSGANWALTAQNSLISPTLLSMTGTVAAVARTFLQINQPQHVESSANSSYYVEFELGTVEWWRLSGALNTNSYFGGVAEGSARVHVTRAGTNVVDVLSNNQRAFSELLTLTPGRYALSASVSVWTGFSLPPNYPPSVSGQGGDIQFRMEAVPRPDITISTVARISTNEWRMDVTVTSGRVAGVEVWSAESISGPFGKEASAVINRITESQYTARVFSSANARFFQIKAL